MSGWIKLHRDIQEHWIYPDREFTKYEAWIDLLMMVNHKDSKTMIGKEIVEVKRGQKITSIRKLCSRWGWSNTKVKTFLKLLEDDGMIKVKSDTKKTLITVVNYGVYQDNDMQKTTGGRQKNDGETTQKHTNKNDKELKKDIYSVFDHWNEKGIIRHRKLTDDIKKTINARLKDGYSLDEILKAIDNYATVLNSDFHFFSHKWVLKDFLNPRNLDRFLDENKPLDIWRKEGAPKERPKPPKNETREEMRLRLLKKSAGNTKLVL